MARFSYHAAMGLLATCAVMATAAPATSAPNDSKPAKAASSAPAGDAGLKARVESLEEQLVDMQVLVGTLETMSKNGGGGGSPAFAATTAAGGDSARIDGLETQVRALTSQVQQLSDQLRSLGATPRRSEAPSSGSAADASGGFGSTTISPDGGNDAIGGMLNGNASQAATAAPLPPGEAGTSGAEAPAGSSQPSSVATAALSDATDAGDPKQLYETAYGYLLQRDYAQAETSFSDFLKKFPNDSLAGNAQYWLGETHFVRGQYKAAAGDFLKGYQNYAQSAKAPDSLLKLAMSLDRMGQKDAACSSYAELSTKFPKASQNVKARAQTERQRVGC